MGVYNMNISVEDMNFIKREILATTDERYVHVDTCTDIQKETTRKFSNDDTRIKLFEQKMKSWEWMFKLIATGTVGTLITSILSLILK